MNAFFGLFVVFTSIFYVSGQPVLGGLSDRDPKEFTAQAWKSIGEINKKHNGPTYLVPIKVVKSQVQVVAGTNTVLQVLVGESSCLKSNAKQIVNQANCPVKTGGKRAIYEVKIWEKLWEKFEQITVEKVRDVKDGEKI